MNFVRLLPVFLSFIVLGAHFLRQGRLEWVALCLLVPCVLLIRRPWAARVVQVALVLGTIEWMWSMVILSRMRQALGESSTRMVLILGGVAIFTLASVFVFRLRPLEERYSRGPGRNE